MAYVMWGSLTNGINFITKSVFALLSWVNLFLQILFNIKRTKFKEYVKPETSTIEYEMKHCQTCIKLIQISYYLKKIVKYAAFKVKFSYI